MMKKYQNPISHNAEFKMMINEKITKILVLATRSPLAIKYMYPS